VSAADSDDLRAAPALPVTIDDVGHFGVAAAAEGREDRAVEAQDGPGDQTDPNDRQDGHLDDRVDVLQVQPLDEAP